MTELSEKIVALREQGMSFRKISETLGCSKGTVSYHMTAGQKEKNLIRRKNGRRKLTEYIQNYKQERGCTDCGENYPYWMLDFDHLKDKEFEINKAHWSVSTIEALQVELDKCEVVCANCHRNRTWMRREGTYSMDVSQHYTKEL